MFTSTRDNGSLAFAVPNTEDSEFTAVCSPASNEATDRARPERPGGAAGRGRERRLLRRRLLAESIGRPAPMCRRLSGLSNPLITLKTDDPLWPAIIRESYLTIQIGSAAPYVLSLKGSAAKARQFLAYCSPRAARRRHTAQMPSPDAGAIPFACDDG